MAIVYSEKPNNLYGYYLFYLILIELFPVFYIIGLILLAGVLNTAIHHDYANPLKSQSVSFAANFIIAL